MMSARRYWQVGSTRARGRFRLITALAAGAVALLALPMLVKLAWAAAMRQSASRERSLQMAVRGNRIARKMAGTRYASRLNSGVALLTHVGRRSGRVYATPVSARPLGDGFVMPLAFGAEVDWYRNVRASGSCTLRWLGHEYALERPELIPIAEALDVYPPFARLCTRIAGTEQAVLLHVRRPVPTSAAPTQRAPGAPPMREPTTERRDERMDERTTLAGAGTGD
jgi:deazaflavin-dependent oxidoreductase (nitroreductase family)